MSRTYRQQGAVLPWINNTGLAVVTDDPIIFGQEGMAIALVDIASLATGSVQLEGVFELPKAAGVITQGQKLWWDAITKQILNAPAKNALFIGYAALAALTGAATANVSLEEFDSEGPRLLTLAATGAETLTVGDFASGDLTLLVPNTAAKTISLPAVASLPVGATLTVRKTTADAYAVTLDPNGGELIAGSATHASIDALNDVAVFVNSGTAWLLKDSHIATGAHLVTLAATGAQSLAAADFATGQCTVLAPNTAALTLTLPAVASIAVGATLLVRKTSADAYAVTLDGNASETVGGSATFATIDAADDWAWFVCSGTAWVLVASVIA